MFVPILLRKVTRNMNTITLYDKNGAGEVGNFRMTHKDKFMRFISKNRQSHYNMRFIFIQDGYAMTKATV